MARTYTMQIRVHHAEAQIAPVSFLYLPAAQGPAGARAHARLAMDLQQQSASTDKPSHSAIKYESDRLDQSMLISFNEWSILCAVQQQLQLQGRTHVSFLTPDLNFKMPIRIIMSVMLTVYQTQYAREQSTMKNHKYNIWLIMHCSKNTKLGNQ